MWRLKISLIAALCAIMISVNGCKKKQIEREVTYRPADFPEILVPPENAIDVRYSNPEFYKTDQGYYFLSYHMVEEYPAEETIEQIRNDLKMKGCIKIEDGAWGSWRTKDQSAPRWTVIHSWMEIWITPSDDFMEVFMNYEYTEGKKEMNKLLVNRTVSTPSSRRVRDRAREYKERYPERFEVNQDEKTMSDDGIKLGLAGTLSLLALGGLMLRRKCRR